MSSIFTREKGFTNLNSSLKFDRKDAIKILNSFTPQGSSPNGSIRITSVDEFLGIGYYNMLSNSAARLSTFLLNTESVGLNIFTPPLVFDPKEVATPVNPIWQENSIYPDPWVFPVIQNFGLIGTSRLLYSFLGGDNILIVHPNQELRLKFLAFFLNIIPSLMLRYNRITLGCSELDGNENIVGVDVLPSKYRSHKKLFLPLDTIFVDLETCKIEGEGVKKSGITDLFAQQLSSGSKDVKLSLQQYFKQILEGDIDDLFGVDLSSESLTERIQIKLNLKSEPTEQEWLMF